VTDALREMQSEAWRNKTAKGFNTTNVPLEFCLLSGEVAKAFDSWRKGDGHLGEELADVAIYLLGLASMTGTDLQAEVEAKLAINAARKYSPLPGGMLAKDTEAGSDG
jgi:NTP pyrophosphatase (non-canonical NTP hydrolase)